ASDVYKRQVYDYAGNDLQFTPRFTTAISAKYLMPARLLGRDLKAIVAADYQYIDPYYMSHMNLYRSAARQLVGGRVGISGRTAEVYLWAKNLLDRRYVISAYEYRGGEQAYLGPPRRIGVTVAYRY
ncbi:MAG: TonB-dependent receptor, partial [Candidatus Eisenbacteria bacterium]|nr:TonB-dependent receptor [Candidatus Eisenbacteria bacterium]